MQRADLEQLLGVLRQAEQLLPADSSKTTLQDLRLRMALLRLQQQVTKRLLRLKPPGRP